MLGRIVEVENDNRHLFVKRGFLVIKQSGADGAELGSIPLDDIAAVIANAHGLSYTNNALVAMAERGIPFVLCAQNHAPVGMLLPLDGHHLQAHRFEAQIQASQPLKKRLWASLVKAKVLNQAALLRHQGRNDQQLQLLAKRIRSGDITNIEAQAARLYWRVLMGKDFYRDRAQAGVNALLNYGYTIVRSAMARAIIASGLHPSIGLHHSNDANAFRLVDDLVEPFRPLVDQQVFELVNQGACLEVTPQNKILLAQIVYRDLATAAGTTPVISCMHRLAISLTKVLVKEQSDLELPSLTFNPTSNECFLDTE